MKRFFMWSLLSFDLLPAFKSNKSFEISFAKEIKSQHAPNKKLKIEVTQWSVAKLDVAWAIKASIYPKGVFQLNGNLK